jgi:hypothetical protein
LYWPWAKLLFHPAALRAAIRAGGASSFVAGLLRRSPAPTLIYHRDDFDNSMFQRVLKSKTIDTGSQALLIELLDEILAGPPPGPAPPPVSLDVLAIGSSRDGLVPLPAVRVFSEQFTTARLIVTEDEFHEPSSHVGYLFKAGLRERVFAEIVSCVRRQLSV